MGWEGTKKAHKNEEGNQNMFLQMGKYVRARMLMAAEKSRKLIGYSKIPVVDHHEVFLRTERWTCGYRSGKMTMIHLLT